MAETFSCTEAFRASYFSNTWEKSLDTLRSRMDSTRASATTATRNTREIRALMKKHMNMEQISVSGARTAMRMHMP